MGKNLWNRRLRALRPPLSTFTTTTSTPTATNSCAHAAASTNHDNTQRQRRRLYNKIQNVKIVLILKVFFILSLLFTLGQMITYYHEEEEIQEQEQPQQAIIKTDNHFSIVDNKQQQSQQQLLPISSSNSTRSNSFNSTSTSTKSKTKSKPASTSTTAGNSIVPNRKKRRRRRRQKLIHVMNTYAVKIQHYGKGKDDNDNDKYEYKYISPFDQWSTIKSIERALLHHNNTSSMSTTAAATTTTTGAEEEPGELLDVDFVCAMFESDVHHLHNLPCRKIILPRSTKTEYSTTTNFDFMNMGNTNDINSIKELPFLQDIINGAIAGSNNDDNVDDFFLMVTNSDIGITKNFYSNLLPKLKHKEALSINRLTIPMTNKLTRLVDNTMKLRMENTTFTTTNNNNNNNDATTLLLHEIDTNLKFGVEHPGFDCFIIHSTVLQKMNLGDLFAGYPPWGSVFDKILQIMAHNYTNYQSSSTGTFHLGSDKSNWISKKKQQQTPTSTTTNSILSSQQTHFNSFKKNYDHLLKSCPKKLFGDHPYTLVNTINCGILYSTTPTSLVTTDNLSSRSSNTDNNNRTLTITKNNKTTIISVPNFVQSGYENRYSQRYKIK